MSYRLDINAELHPRGEHQFWYPGAVRGGKEASLFVRVTPDRGEPWWAVFSGGSEMGLASAVLEWPQTSRFCIISGGRGYVVSVDDPTDWLEMALRPIRSAHPVPGKPLVVVTDYQSIAAYGPEGQLWRVQSPTYGEPKIEHVGENEVKGVAWDYGPRGEDLWIPFRIKTMTGESLSPEGKD